MRVLRERAGVLTTELVLNIEREPLSTSACIAGVNIVYSLVLSNSESFPVLLGSHESDNGVRAYSEVIGGQTGPEASNTLFGH